MKTRVMIVDDSLVFRKILQDALGSCPDIEVVGTASNGREAISKIRSLSPHLLVLDVEMPEMDGLATLDAIRAQGLDVGAIMFSTLTSQGASTTLDALSKGAFDFVPKPTGTGAFAESITRIKAQLIPKIESFGLRLNGKGPRPATLGVLQPAQTRSAPCPRTAAAPPGLHSSPRQPTGRIGLPPEAVGIGVSTGGPNALNDVIPRFPKGFPLPVFLVQHMPPVFTAQLARRLNEKSGLNVVEAADRMPVDPGTVYVAPGDFHMVVTSEEGGRRVIRLNQSPPVNSCRPAVDVLFDSLAQVYGGRVVAVVMTGMGQDGLAGSRVLKEKGALLIAQDKETSVVWGMPRFVTEAGLVDHSVPLGCITETILEVSRTGGRR